MTHRTNRRAFTIIELTIAFAILILGVYAIFEQFIKTQSLGQRKFIEAQGHLFAQQKMAELSACRFEDLAAWKAPREFQPLAEDPRYFYRSDVTHRAEDNGLNLNLVVAWNPKDDEKQTFDLFNTATARGVRFP